jgi:hypothetical protein
MSGDAMREQQHGGKASRPKRKARWKDSVVMALPLVLSAARESGALWFCSPHGQ